MVCKVVVCVVFIVLMVVAVVEVVVVEFDDSELLEAVELDETVLTAVELALVVFELEFATVVLDDAVELVVSEFVDGVVVVIVLFGSCKGPKLVTRALLPALAPCASVRARNVGETSEIKATSIRAIANGFKRPAALESGKVDSSLMPFLRCDQDVYVMF